MKTPCKGCEKRYVGCHAKCEDYKAYRVPFDEMQEKRRRESVVAAMANDRTTRNINYKKSLQK